LQRAEIFFDIPLGALFGLEVALSDYGCEQTAAHELLSASLAQGNLAVARPKLTKLFSDGLPSQKLRVAKILLLCWREPRL
jgi:hypothetical protein